MHIEGYQEVIVLIYIVIGASILSSFKNIGFLTKVSIYVVLLNLILTIISPEWSLFNILTTDTICKNTDTKNLIDSWAIRGQIGDILAGHFTVLAVIGLMTTIQQMNKSILIQKKQSEEQSKYIKYQKFENKFFKLLDVMVEIKNSENILNSLEELNNTINETNNLIITKEQYNEKLNEYKNLLKFFNFIIFILKEIDKNDIVNDKQYFSNLIKFNLLSIETTFLYVTIISKSENIELIEKYHLDDYIDIESNDYFHLNFIINDN